jgi:hypothetical protein
MSEVTAFAVDDKSKNLRELISVFIMTGWEIFSIINYFMKK